VKGIKDPMIFEDIPSAEAQEEMPQTSSEENQTGDQEEAVEELPAPDPRDQKIEALKKERN